MRREFEVTCPNCSGWLLLDLETGEVIRHGAERPKKAPPRKKGDVKAFDDALDRVTKRAADPADPFDDALRSLKDQKKKLDRAFDDAKKKVKDDPDADDLPRRPFDLD